MSRRKAYFQPPLICRIFGHKIVWIADYKETRPDSNACCKRCGVGFIIGRTHYRDRTKFKQAVKKIIK